MIFKFSRKQAEQVVWEYVRVKSGIPEGEKLDRFKKTAYKYKPLTDGRVDLRAAAERIDDFSFKDGRLFVGGSDYGSFKISGFDAGKVRRLYAYVICAGDFETDKDTVSDAFADLWGNAYCDAAHGLLKERLAAEEKDGLDISPPFGPGFFGIGTEKLADIMEMAGAASIGVTLRGSHMSPLKSCAGFFLASEAPVKIPEKNCDGCLGSRKNCNYCRFYDLERITGEGVLRGGSHEET